MNLKLSFDDGCDYDRKAAKLAEEYDIPCTFYIPIQHQIIARQKGYPELNLKTLKIFAKKFNIGSHGVTHRHLTKLSIPTAKDEIRESKNMLENILEVEVKSFAPSRGYTTPELTEYTLSIYDDQRLTKGYDSGGYKLVHLHPDSGANDNKPWQECITEDKIHLWGHSYDLQNFDLWDELEGFLSENAHS